MKMFSKDKAAWEVCFFPIKDRSLSHRLHCCNIGTTSVIRRRWDSSAFGMSVWLSMLSTSRHALCNNSTLCLRVRVVHPVSACVSNLLASHCSVNVALSLIACHVSRCLGAKLPSGQDASTAVPGWSSQAQFILQLPTHRQRPAAVRHAGTCKLLLILCCFCCINHQKTQENSFIGSLHIHPALLGFFSTASNTHAPLHLPLVQIHKQAGYIKIVFINIVFSVATYSWAQGQLEGLPAVLERRQGIFF